MRKTIEKILRCITSQQIKNTINFLNEIFITLIHNLLINLLIFIY